MGKHFGSGPRARVCVRALEDDGEAARALALAELELTLDVVNFFADIFQPGRVSCSGRIWKRFVTGSARRAAQAME